MTTPGTSNDKVVAAGSRKNNKKRDEHETSIRRPYLVHPKEWIVSAAVCVLLFYFRFLHQPSSRIRVFSDGTTSLFENMMTEHEVRRQLHHYCDVDMTLKCIDVLYKPYAVTHCDARYGAALTDLLRVSSADGWSRLPTKERNDGIAVPSKTIGRNSITASAIVSNERTNGNTTSAPTILDIESNPDHRSLRWKSLTKKNKGQPANHNKKHHASSSLAQPSPPPKELRCSLRDLIVAQFGDYDQTDVAEEFVIVQFLSTIMVETVERNSKRFGWTIENRGFYSDGEREQLIEYYLEEAIDLLAPTPTNKTTSRAVEGEIVEHVYSRSSLLKMLKRAAKPFRSNRHIKRVVSKMEEDLMNENVSSKASPARKQTRLLLQKEDHHRNSKKEKHGNSSSSSSLSSSSTSSKSSHSSKREEAKVEANPKSSTADKIVTRTEMNSSQNRPMSTVNVVQSSTTTYSASTTSSATRGYLAVSNHASVATTTTTTTATTAKHRIHYFYPTDLDQCMYSHFENDILATELCHAAMKAAKTKLWQVQAFPVSTDFVIMTHFGFLGIHLVCFMMLIQSFSLKKRFVKKMDGGRRRLEEELNDPVLRASLEHKAQQLYTTTKDRRDFIDRLQNKLNTWDSSSAASKQTLKFVTRFRYLLLLAMFCNAVAGIVLAIFHEGSRTRFLESMFSALLLWTISYAIPITAEDEESMSKVVSSIFFLITGTTTDDGTSDSSSVLQGAPSIPDLTPTKTAISSNQTMLVEGKKGSMTEAIV